MELAKPRASPPLLEAMLKESGHGDQRPRSPAPASLSLRVEVMPNYSKLVGLNIQYVLSPNFEFALQQRTFRTIVRCDGSVLTSRLLDNLERNAAH